ncbi:hypothetical protein CFC21_095113 [Triticum aestivum]|uniref:Uncharacterized protein n=2 Tax=Triticum aestivum TaxID=4565 RepID=A0A9R1MXB6_WHEAT|nr:uncharacterized protein LOC123152335 isoform X2 [Triticum aestivum]KAF7092652.1 hypothetical protein CFC21_095113 [Triticum aestivum]
MAGQHSLAYSSWSAGSSFANTAVQQALVYPSPATSAGSSLVSTARVQQARCYSAGALVIDEETVQALVTGVAKCNSVASKCLAEIQTVQDLQIITLVVILSGVVGAWYVGQQVIDRGSEILGQLQKHAPEILGGVCDEMVYQLKIPFFGSGRRLVLQDYWFNDPEKSLTRYEQRMRREAARLEMDRLRLEEFNRAQEEKKREAAQMYEQSLARKQINDLLLKDKLREERIKQLTGQ